MNTRGCCTKPSDSKVNELKERGNPDVVKIWTEAILTQGSTEGQGSSLVKETLLKRPPAGEFQKEVKPERKGSSESVPTSTYRRRLSDNKWTTAKMDDKIIWVDCEVGYQKLDFLIQSLLGSATN